MTAQRQSPHAEMGWLPFSPKSSAMVCQDTYGTRQPLMFRFRDVPSRSIRSMLMLSSIGEASQALFFRMAVQGFTGSRLWRRPPSPQDNGGIGVERRFYVSSAGNAIKLWHPQTADGLGVSPFWMAVRPRFYHVWGKRMETWIGDMSRFLRRTRR
jgi:hypothetical protein